MEHHSNELAHKSVPTSSTAYQLNAVSNGSSSSTLSISNSVAARPQPLNQNRSTIHHQFQRGGSSNVLIPPNAIFHVEQPFISKPLSVQNLQSNSMSGLSYGKPSSNSTQVSLNNIQLPSGFNPTILQSGSGQQALIPSNLSNSSTILSLIDSHGNTDTALVMGTDTVQEGPSSSQNDHPIDATVTASTSSIETAPARASVVDVHPSRMSTFPAVKSSSIVPTAAPLDPHLAVLATNHCEDVLNKRLEVSYRIDNDVTLTVLI